MYKHKCVLLLTACVNANGMLFTALQDAEERKQQYIDSLSYYLQETNIPVVFVENSNCDFSSLFKSFIESGRLEYICFDGNTYDRSRGKGYGEALILNYAFLHSTFLKNSRYVVKITGRLIVKNINSIAQSNWLIIRNVFRCDFRWKDYIWSMVLVCQPSFLRDTINDYLDRIDDSRHVYFEHVVYKSLLESKCVFIVPFIYSPQIIGVSGTSNISYSNLVSSTQFLDNLRLSARLLKKKGKILTACLFFFLFLCLKPFYKCP